jgi:hypothetical protein
MEVAYELDNHPIAVPEPERAILNGKARRITVRRIGYRLLPFPGEPKPGLPLLQGWRQGREIELRNYGVLLFL